MISLCMIVKNEERTLDRCLSSVKNIVDEIIIADTGSEDNTVRIAENSGAKVIRFKWNNNFSDARNFALSNCSHEWILYLDADEYLSSASVNALKIISNSKPDKAFYCKIINEDTVNNRPSVMLYPRVFPKKPGIHFKGAVHEQIEYSLAENNVPVVESKVVIIHTGYDISDSDKQRKAERNLTILLENYTQKSDSYTAFQIAQSYGILQNKTQAEHYFRESVKDTLLRKEYRALAYRYLGLNLAEKNQLDEARNYLNNSLKLDNMQPITLFGISEVEKKIGNLSSSLVYLQQAYIVNQKLLQGEAASFQAICVSDEMIFQSALEVYLLSDCKENFSFFFNILPERYIEIINQVNEYIKTGKVSFLLIKIVAQDFLNTTIPSILGKFFRNHQENETSTAFYKLALESGTNDLSVYMFVIADYITHGELEQALILANKAKELAKGNDVLERTFSSIISRLITSR